jgi:hypothetical protein
MRIYLPEDEQDSPVVICSELPSNEGSSVTYSAHQIAAEVIRYHKLSAPVWIEHYPKEATDGASETFELVVFSSYEIRERAPYLGETRLTIGVLTQKTLDGSMKRETGTVESWRSPLSKGRVTSHGVAHFTHSPKVEEGRCSRKFAKKVPKVVHWGMRQLLSNGTITMREY